MPTGQRKSFISAVVSLVVLAVLAAGAYVAGKHFYRETGPPAQEVAQGMILSLNKANTMQGRITSEVSFEGDLPAPYNKLLQKQSLMDMRLVVHDNGLYATGRAGAFKNIRYLLDESGQYAFVQGKWYGDDTNNDFSSSSNITRKEAQKAAKSLSKYFEAQTHSGEVIQGEETWEMQGKLPDTKAQENPFLDTQAVLDALEWKILVGRKQDFIYRAEASLTGSPQDWITAPVPVDITNFKADIVFEAQSWNKPVKIPSAPTSYLPLSELGKSLQETPQGGLEDLPGVPNNLPSIPGVSA